MTRNNSLTMHKFHLGIGVLLICLSCKESSLPSQQPATEIEAAVNDNVNDSSEIASASENIKPAPMFTPRFGGGGGGGRGGRRDRNDYIHFVPNSYEFWTDPANATTFLLEGCTGENCECTPGDANCQSLPAFANVVLDGSNFVWCKGGPYAVCYYSGSEDESIDLSCTLSEDGRFANCKCFEIPWGVYFVDINSILNYKISEQTKKICNDDGSGCVGAENINKAPVCEAINRNKFIPEADLVSTFSFSCVPTNGLGQTNCSDNVYAGCMTAPCQRTSTPGIVECSCPTFDGPYQVGTTLASPEEECSLGDNLVWSAAYSPSVSTIPPTSPCIPDAPGGNGCPLYDPCTMSLPGGTDCEAICDAYACLNDDGIEAAFTCDATLCTGECNERQLLQEACDGLSSCPAAGLVAIATLESEVGCSCCASQLCNCQPSIATNEAIATLNQQQRNLGITPQCDVNGTLCGTSTASDTSKGCAHSDVVSD